MAEAEHYHLRPNMQAAMPSDTRYFWWAVPTMAQVALAGAFEAGDLDLARYVLPMTVYGGSHTATAWDYAQLAEALERPAVSNPEAVNWVRWLRLAAIKRCGQRIFRNTHGQPGEEKDAAELLRAQLVEKLVGADLAEWPKILPEYSDSQSDWQYQEPWNRPERFQ